MTTQVATFPFPARLRTPLQLDPVLLGIVLTLLFGGLVILASASISVSDTLTGRPFYYVERQLLAAVIGAAGAGACLYIPMQFSLSLLLIARCCCWLASHCCSSSSYPASATRLTAASGGSASGS